MVSTASSPEKKKSRLPLIIGGAVLVGGVAAFFIFHQGDEDSGPTREHEISIVLPPPPPPPPPPPKVEPPKPEQQKFVQETAPTEKPPEKQPEAAPITTSIKGEGDSGLGLGNGGGAGGSGFGGGGGGSKYGYYAGRVQSRVAEILRTNKKTRAAVMDHVRVRIWADSGGHISKVSLGQSTGDPSLDTAIKSEVFSDVTLESPPPEGMPMPIVMSFTARRPN